MCVAKVLSDAVASNVTVLQHVALFNGSQVIQNLICKICLLDLSIIEKIHRVVNLQILVVTFFLTLNSQSLCPSLSPSFKDVV